MLVVSADRFNFSRIATVVGVVLTSNLGLVVAPGNVLVPRSASGLPRDSVANVSQIVTVDRRLLGRRVGVLGHTLLGAVDAGLALVLDLG
jgi:mRNA interferase MazF